MNENRQPHESRMKTFTCAGCGVKIRINEKEPRRCRFVWRDRKNKDRSYCYDCDGNLIDGTPLPRDKK